MASIPDSSCYLKIPCLLLHSELPDSVQKVLARLQHHLNRSTGQCNPRIATLADEVGLGERAVKYAIAWLRHAGIVSGRGRGRSARSYVLAPEEQWPGLLEKGKKCPIKRAKSALLKGQKVPFSTPVSINEAEHKKQNREAGGGNQNGTRAREEAPRQAISNTVTTTTSPASQSAYELARELALTHPQRGSLRAAAEALDDLGLTEALGNRIRAAHASAVPVLVSLRDRDSEAFVPNLARWIRDRDWEGPPPKKPVNKWDRMIAELEAEEAAKKARAATA